MEFEDDDDLEEGREEEEEEEGDDNDDDDAIEGITIPPQTPVSSATTAAAGERKAAAATRYLNCQKNHAVSIGGHAVDGCGEFMPAGEDGTLAALKCAACGCHRNFHRKEITDTTPATAAVAYPQFPQPQPPPGYHRRLLALPSTSSGRGEDVEELSNPSSSGGGGSGRKKRFRTKFTAAQKEMMAAFADRVGWRIQKHDEAAVQQFCRDAQVTRQVLKVWMHNNKHTLGRKP